jgi:hypothetical protein
MVFNVTFNNISVITWESVLLVDETGVRYIGPGLENQEEACESLKSPIALDS